MPPNRTVLIVEDDNSLRRVMEFHLAESGCAVLSATTAEKGVALFREEGADVVVTDMQLPGKGGLDLLREIKRFSPRTPVIVLTAYGTIETAVEAMRDGAFHYVTKPVSNDELSLLVERALQHAGLEAENERLRLELRQRYKFENIVGESGPMKHLFEIMARVAPKDASVLIEGESGTGKELIARAIHYNSSRAGKPLVPINCGAIPRDLVESELFGVTKGAYTGAVKDRPGRFEQAGGGTVFLDEVAELPPEAQVKLLRVLQERTVTRLGGEKAVPVDVRVIAAANRSLAGAVAEGEFREDIYYRLNVVSIQVPPLRERAEDIPILVRHFLEKFGQPGAVVAPKAMALLQEYSWPGNVRQLENIVERAVVLQRLPGQIGVGDLPEEIRYPAPRLVLASLGFPDEGVNLEENEKTLIRMALGKADGNQTRAAELLGITRYALLYRMQKHGLR